MSDNGLSINSSELTNKDIVVTYRPLSDVVSYSYQVIKDGNVVQNINVDKNKESIITFDKTGTYQLKITTYDGFEYNTITSGLYKLDKEYKTITLVSNSQNKINHQLFINQISIIAFLVILLIVLLRYNRTLKYEKRISKYTVKSLKENNKSLFETFDRLGNGIIDKLTKLVSKSELANKISIRYDKYVKAFNQGSNIRFIAKKILVGFIFVIIGFIITTLRFETLNIYSMVMLFIVGYYTLDIIYKYYYYLYCKQIENDLLQAIIIMNNAFKSGRSIRQAIDLVGNELKGPISLEFKKISYELELGLDIEVAFKRFSERINIEEAMYLTSSLSILNKTGGNIVEVFSSIEKTLYNRKKLRVELKELTGSSRIIMWVLTIVPIAFTALLLIVNPEYFKPLYTNFLGFVVIGAIMVLYVVYIVIVRKIMKIRM